MGSPDRFATARDVGPFLGLVPGRDQSGDVDKPMRITKAGNRMMRRLLVSFKPHQGDYNESENQLAAPRQDTYKYRAW
ncbi:transposase [Thalassobacterium maritimum]|uniref:transposase n=1 Tax=Thalassobacterium maritimum TaxID=3041265 RepID=UPI003CE50BA6